MKIPVFARSFAVIGMCLSHGVLGLSQSKMELVTDDLPDLENFLKELELTHLTERFHASGFTETKYILRMKDMDMRIMSKEWGVNKETIQRVKDAIQIHKVERLVVSVVEDPLMVLRNSLTYGKLVVEGSTTSYEYYTAHFSAPMPLEWMDLVVAPDTNSSACALDGGDSMSGKILLAGRGECSFLDKATNASAVNASALVLVNNGSDLFQIAAGYATGANSEESTDIPDALPMVIRSMARFTVDLQPPQTAN